MRNVDAAGLGIGDDYPTRIMGVLNVSKESPYEPSVFDDHGEAAEYVDEQLIGEGADIVDVGLESANKKFEVLSAEGELDRLDTAIDTIDALGYDTITGRIERLTDRLKDGLGDRLLSPREYESGLVTFSADDPAALVDRLADEGIHIRSLPYPDAVRASVHVFNTADDVDALLDAL